MNGISLDAAFSKDDNTQANRNVKWYTTCDTWSLSLSKYVSNNMVLIEGKHTLFNDCGRVQDDELIASWNEVWAVRDARTRWNFRWWASHAAQANVLRWVLTPELPTYCRFLRCWRLISWVVYALRRYSDVSGCRHVSAGRPTWVALKTCEAGGISTAVNQGFNVGEDGPWTPSYIHNVTALRI